MENENNLLKLQIESLEQQNMDFKAKLDDFEDILNDKDKLLELI